MPLDRVVAGRPRRKLDECHERAERNKGGKWCLTKWASDEDERNQAGLRNEYQRRLAWHKKKMMVTEETDEGISEPSPWELRVLDERDLGQTVSFVVSATARIPRNTYDILFVFFTSYLLPSRNTLGIASNHPVVLGRSAVWTHWSSCKKRLLLGFAFSFPHD